MPVYLPPGYYPKGGPSKSNQEAQIDMIDESLRWAGISEATAVSLLLCKCLDVALHTVAYCVGQLCVTHSFHASADVVGRNTGLLLRLDNSVLSSNAHKP